MSSVAARVGRIRFDDLQWERRYRAWGAYGQSKLADLMFARHLAAAERGPQHSAAGSARVSSSADRRRRPAYQSRAAAPVSRASRESARLPA